MSEAVELEGCPFCGGPAEIWRASPGTTRKAWIACMGRCVAISKEHETDAEAIAAWNRRALTKTGGEPVAWRWREPDSTLWAATAHRHIADNLAADPHFEVQPLYASDGAGRPLVERTVVEIPPLTEEQRAYLEPLLRREPVDMSVVIGGPSAALSDGAGQVDGEG